jgi:hypothetical protein
LRALKFLFQHRYRTRHPTRSSEVRDNQRLVRPPWIPEIDALPAEAAAAGAYCFRIERRMATSRRVSVVSGVVESGQERGHANFRRAMCEFASGVAIVTCANGKESARCTRTALASLNGDLLPELSLPAVQEGKPTPGAYYPEALGRALCRQFARHQLQRVRGPERLARAQSREAHPGSVVRKSNDERDCSPLDVREDVVK